MNRTRTFAAVAAPLAVTLGTVALTAGAQSAAHASACAFGKEATGCKLNGTGYGDFKSRLFIGFPASTSPKGTATELSIPVSQVCPQVSEEVSLFAKGKGTARIGSTIKFSGKAAIKSSTTLTAVPSKVKSAKVTATLTLTNAKSAKLSGKAEVTLEGGTKCSKKLPSKLLRILGG
jgi:hypothetical protein